MLIRCNYISIRMNSIYSIHNSYVSFLISGCIASIMMTLCLIMFFSDIDYALQYSLYFYYCINLSHLLLFIILIYYFHWYIMIWLNDFYLESYVFFTLHEQYLILYSLKLFVFSEFMIFVCLFSSWFNFLFSCSLFVLCSFPVFSYLTFSAPSSNLMLLVYSSFFVQSISLLVLVGFSYLVYETLLINLIFANCFLSLQLKEFMYSYFSTFDGFIGSVFFDTVSMHGIHVLFGSYFLFLIFITHIHFLSYSSYFIPLSHYPLFLLFSSLLNPYFDTLFLNPSSLFIDFNSNSIITNNIYINSNNSYYIKFSTINGFYKYSFFPYLKSNDSHLLSYLTSSTPLSYGHLLSECNSLDLWDDSD